MRFGLLAEIERLGLLVQIERLGLLVQIVRIGFLVQIVRIGLVVVIASFRRLAKVARIGLRGRFGRGRGIVIRLVLVRPFVCARRLEWFFVIRVPASGFKFRLEILRRLVGKGRGFVQFLVTRIARFLLQWKRFREGAVVRLFGVLHRLQAILGLEAILWFRVGVRHRAGGRSFRRSVGRFPIILVSRGQEIVVIRGRLRRHDDLVKSGELEVYGLGESRIGLESNIAPLAAKRTEPGHARVAVVSHLLTNALDDELQYRRDRFARGAEATGDFGFEVEMHVLGNFRL